MHFIKDKASTMVRIMLADYELLNSFELITSYIFINFSVLDCNF